MKEKSHKASISQADAVFAKVAEGDRFELSRVYGHCAVWIRGGNRPPEIERAWLADRLDALKAVLWAAASQATDPKDFENQIAKAAGVTRKRGRPKPRSVDVRSINKRLKV
jgi:hypothetical protein